jgi:beta-galactosidase
VTETLATRASLAASGLQVAGRVVPLIGGSVHYWRHDPRSWRRCLEALVSLGAGFVDVYVPWAEHELEPGEHDFGRRNPRLDVVRFLRTAHELGLLAIVRPGPHINAELTCFGIPRRVIWDPACQARSPRGNPVMLPAPPLAFPVPSYGSRRFACEAAVWLGAVGRHLAPQLVPQGPIAMVQVDNEGALYFRDGAYDQDYHPDTVHRYREWLERKHGTLEALREAHGIEVHGWGDVHPPSRFDALGASDLGRHLDWSAFSEQLVADFLAAMRGELERAGLAGVPTVHNLPVAEHASALGSGAVGSAVDLVGIDSYYLAGPAARRDIARRTSALAVACDARGVPPFACEMAAGFAPFMPPLGPSDNAFALLCALAYGLRGFNLYMAVDRDRWVGAPFGSDGAPGESAEAWRALVRMVRRTRLAELRRLVPVRLVTPRLARRLERVMHAFGPVTGSAFAVAGAGAAERCLETDLGLGVPVALETEAFVGRVEAALERRAVPFAHVEDDAPEACVHGARWLVVATPAGMVDRAFLESIGAFVRAGGRVTFGPHAPSLDQLGRPLGGALGDWARGAGGVGDDAVQVVGADRAAIERHLDRAIGSLPLRRVRVSPRRVHVTVLEDERREARVVFVINPSGVPARVRLSIEGVERAQDAFDAAPVPHGGEGLELSLPARQVRVLAVASG